jgi:hypothetical protein
MIADEVQFVFWSIVLSGHLGTYDMRKYDFVLGKVAGDGSRDAGGQRSGPALNCEIWIVPRQKAGQRAIAMNTPHQATWCVGGVGRGAMAEN